MARTVSLHRHGNQSGGGREGMLLFYFHFIVTIQKSSALLGIFGITARNIFFKCFSVWQC